MTIKTESSFWLHMWQRLCSEGPHALKKLRTRLSTLGTFAAGLGLYLLMQHPPQTVSDLLHSAGFWLCVAAILVFGASVGTAFATADPRLQEGGANV